MEYKQKFKKQPSRKESRYNQPEKKKIEKEK